MTLFCVCCCVCAHCGAWLSCAHLCIEHNTLMKKKCRTLKAEGGEFLPGAKDYPRHNMRHIELRQRFEARYGRKDTASKCHDRSFMAFGWCETDTGHGVGQVLHGHWSISLFPLGGGNLVSLCGPIIGNHPVIILNLVVPIFFIFLFLPLENLFIMCCMLIPKWGLIFFRFPEHCGRRGVGSHRGVWVGTCAPAWTQAE
ncbi:hypothetical protein B0H16DRAFT_134180 [Mycena metata]|uniref:Secreted protein n=1 Tax=Mycena metata TaxID=1033252 RepID=A0AAD7I500_9AGAR|nr:hypothetical protein B0H16DRAFT_134180 [Mycena metata]